MFLAARKGYFNSVAIGMVMHFVFGMPIVTLFVYISVDILSNREQDIVKSL